MKRSKTFEKTTFWTALVLLTVGVSAAWAYFLFVDPSFFDPYRRIHNCASCEQASEMAANDFAKDNYQIVLWGRYSEGDPSLHYVDTLEKLYNVTVLGGGCTQRNEVNCYNTTMWNLLVDKHGHKLQKLRFKWRKSDFPDIWEIGKVKEKKLVSQMDRIDEVLWNDWNPLHLKGETNRDEYRGYIPEILKYKQENLAPFVLSKRLLEFETHYMGLSGDKIRCDSVAVKIVRGS